MGLGSESGQGVRVGEGQWPSWLSGLGRTPSTGSISSAYSLDPRAGHESPLG